jgi:HAD superfamily hydrolase (TIGR01484 family)
MKSIEALPAGTCKRIEFIFSDLDDTLTLDGKITAGAYHALWNLRRAGIGVVIVTGRPAGWADAILRLMPVDHVIAENGALTLSYDKNLRRMVRDHALGKKQRDLNRRTLDAAARKILAAVPEVSLAADQAFRESDIAFDICEDADRLDPAAMARLENLIRLEGLRYKVSSIHVNAWIGGYDKESACTRLIEKLGAARRRRPLVLFIGDSPNDEPLFASFRLSVGVANIARFAERMSHLPGYVTEKRGAEGFVQTADHILKRRR